MEPLQKHKHTVKAMEVLYFDMAVLEKTKGGMTSFSTIGPLSILYFKKYDRFVLRLNDWMYPLMSRLPMMAMNEASYMMPAMNGFAYKLKIMGESNPNMISNLETILSRNTRFANKGEEMPSQKMELMSPDDKVVRQMNEETESVGMMMNDGKMKMSEEMLKKMSMLTRMMSRQKKFDYTKIETKDWRKEAKSRIRSYVETTEKVTQEFMNLRRNNSNLTQKKEYVELKNTDSKLPVLYMKREEIEEAILTNKDLTDQGDYDWSQMMVDQVEKRQEEIARTEKQGKGGVMNLFWSSLSGIKNYIFGRGNNTSPSPASKAPTAVVTTVPENKQGDTEETEGPISEAVKVMAEECHLKDVGKLPPKAMVGIDMEEKAEEKNSEEIIMG